MSLASMKEHKLLKEQVETLTEEQDELREEIASLEDTKDNLENEVENHQGDMDCQAKAYEEKFEKLTAEIEELKEENASMNVVKWANDFRDLKEENKKLKAKNVKNKYDKFKCEKCKGHHTGCANPTCDSCVEELKTSLQTTTSYHTDKYELLKEENEELKIYANPDNNRLNRRLLRAEKCLNFDARDKDMAYLLYSDEEDESIGPNRGEDDREQKIKSYAYNYKATLERNAIEIEESKEYNEKLKAEIEELKEEIDDAPEMRYTGEEMEKMVAVMECMDEHPDYNDMCDDYQKEIDFLRKENKQKTRLLRKAREAKTI